MRLTNISPKIICPLLRTDDSRNHRSNINANSNRKSVASFLREILDELQHIKRQLHNCFCMVWKRRWKISCNHISGSNSLYLLQLVLLSEFIKCTKYFVDNIE